jgi:hypothetical protein
VRRADGHTLWRRISLTNQLRCDRYCEGRRAACTA